MSANVSAPPRHAGLTAMAAWISSSRDALARIIASGIGALPGLLLTGGIAAAAFALHLLPGAKTFSPLILAIVLGIAFHNLVGTPACAHAGVAVSLRKVLRFSIILLGLQLTAAQVAEVGATGIALIAATLVAAFVFTMWLGRLLGV